MSVYPLCRTLQDENGAMERSGDLAYTSVQGCSPEHGTACHCVTSFAEFCRRVQVTFGAMAKSEKLASTTCAGVVHVRRLSIDRCSLSSTGDVWGHGQEREGGIYPRASAALPGQEGLCEGTGAPTWVLAGQAWLGSE